MSDFAHLVLEHRAMLVRYARYLSRDDADDLVQDTIVRSLAKKDQFKPGTNLQAWLMTVMKGIWLDEVRRRKRREYTDIERVELIHYTDFDNIVLAHEIAAYIARPATRKFGTNSCMPRYYTRNPAGIAGDIIALAMDDASRAEIAERLNLPVGTVKSRLDRAREDIRAFVG